MSFSRRTPLGYVVLLVGLHVPFLGCHILLCEGYSFLARTYPKSNASPRAMVRNNASRRSIVASASVDNGIRHDADFLSSHEEKDRRELRKMSWLIKSTSKILGENVTPVGQLPRDDVRRAKPVMRAWARRSSRRRSSSSGELNGAPHVVERLLARINEERDAGNEDAAVTTDMYNLLIEAWARSSGSAQRAEESLDRMEQMAISGNANVRPNSRSINTVIKAWVKSGEPGALERAEVLLGRAEKSGLVTTRSYNLYLSALAQTSIDKDAAEKAEKLIERMKQLSKETNGAVWLDINTYNQVMSCWARRGGERAADRAQKIFDDLMLNHQSNETDAVIPNTATFKTLLNCYHKSGGTSTLQRVKELLGVMDEMYHTGTIEAKPDLVTVNTALTVFAKVRTNASFAMAEDLFSRAKNVYNINLDTLSYNLLINMMSDRGVPQAAEKSVRLLDQMESHFRSNFGSGQPSVMPDAHTYTSVIDTLAKSNIKGCGKEANDVLDRMERLHRNSRGQKPTTQVFNAVINAWASSKEKGSVRRAEAVIKQMEERYKAGDEFAKPNRRSYNTLLKAYTLHGKGSYAGKSESLLRRMEEAYKSGDNGISPDRYSYTTTISGYARSNLPDKAPKALEILHRMSESYDAGNSAAKPTVHAFNACLNACAFTFARGEKMEAFLVAVSTFLMLQKYHEPDHITFSTFLRACSNLIPKGEERRDRIVEVVFRRCCRDGHVSALVLQQLCFAASPILYRKLIGEDTDKQGVEGIGVGDLPLEWRRNVH